MYWSRQLQQVLLKIAYGTVIFNKHCFICQKKQQFAYCAVSCAYQTSLRLPQSADERSNLYYILGKFIRNTTEIAPSKSKKFETRTLIFHVYKSAKNSNSSPFLNMQYGKDIQISEPCRFHQACPIGRGENGPAEQLNKSDIYLSQCKIVQIYLIFIHPPQYRSSTPTFIRQADIASPLICIVGNDHFPIVPDCPQHGR